MSNSYQAKKKVLIANRGEIAIRISQALAALGYSSVAIFSEDDVNSLHRYKADEAFALQGRGAAAYLDAAQIIAAARELGCDGIHPGYGFLSENSEFSAMCAAEGIVFIGSPADQLELFGNKAAAKQVAMDHDVPIIPGLPRVEEGKVLLDFLAQNKDVEHVMLKPVSGGGGRGMRKLSCSDANDEKSVNDLLNRCQSEAEKAFGESEIYLETVIEKARHVEVQIAGDGQEVIHLWDRDCSIQRLNQKIIEIAPSPNLSEAVRGRLLDCALRMAKGVALKGVGTFEFLLDADIPERFYFLEMNPRIQVEHTVTEEITGVDLVATQIQLAFGVGLSFLGLAQSPEYSGYAIQLRVNLEQMKPDGSVRASAGRITEFLPPFGRGIRVDTCGFSGFQANPAFDTLVAKLICRSDSDQFSDALNLVARALNDFQLQGVESNLNLLKNIVNNPIMENYGITTQFISEQIESLTASLEDPLAVLNHAQEQGGGVSSESTKAEANLTVNLRPGESIIQSQLQGSVVSVEVSVGDSVASGSALVVVDSMKMEHVITAPENCVVSQVLVADHTLLFEGDPLLVIQTSDIEGASESEQATASLEAIRKDLQEVMDRHGVGLDENRPESVAKRRKTGQRTARENLTDLCDDGSYVEYGALVLAAQRRRRSIEELIEKSPADGMIAGIGAVNGQFFSEEMSQCAVVSYDYTVMAGTQGHQNHRKKDRLFEVTEQMQIPLIFFTEGGGGRPGDTDGVGGAGLDCLAFQLFSKLSGLVPLIGIVSGRCFAGNAALLGCCDVIIATENANIGMGGPAMIEGGGLGVYRPEEIGPIDVQTKNGVVDIAVQDEVEAVSIAKKYLSYFQGSLKDWDCVDQRTLRHVIPENRLRVYDVRDVIETLCDTDSLLELRRDFALNMVTAFGRVEGRPVGIIANNPVYLSGAIDHEASDKATRFMQLCDAFDLPILFLCDTPGFMVGPDIEQQALVRHAGRLFVTAGSIDVPFFTIVLRKGYGLGAMTMAGGSFKTPLFTVAWPSGEFGGMGLEGAVKLGFRKELEAIEDPAERKATYDFMVAKAYEHGKAINTASYFEIDDVIDPAESREWIMSVLKTLPKEKVKRKGKKRGCVDAW